MFSIATEPLDVAQLAGRLPHPAGGAIVTFEGRVRNHNDGLTVTGLEYQAYQPLAHSEGLRILREAESRSPSSTAVAHTASARWGWAISPFG